MRVNRYLMPAVVILVLLGVVYGAKAAGYWRTLPPEPAQAAGATERPDPGAIKGYMSLDEVVATYAVPRDGLYSAIKAPADVDAKKPLKELKSVIPGFETDQVRDFVQQYYDSAPTP